MHKKVSTDIKEEVTRLGVSTNEEVLEQRRQAIEKEKAAAAAARMQAEQGRDGNVDAADDDDDETVDENNEDFAQVYTSPSSVELKGRGCSIVSLDMQMLWIVTKGARPALIFQPFCQAHCLKYAALSNNCVCVCVCVLRRGNKSYLDRMTCF